MTEVRGIHDPYCNFRCQGDRHWLRDLIEGATDDVHAHGGRQAPVCAACIAAESSKPEEDR